jgi:hypothetical protein
MPQQRIDMDVFSGLPMQEQLAHLMLRGEDLHEGTSASQFMYRLDDYYVRVSVSSNPLRVREITVSRNLRQLSAAPTA